jgi:DNA mismatch repair protein MutS
MALTEEYFRLSNEYTHKYGKKTILLMQVGSFFECYSKTDSVGNITDANMKEFCSACDLNCSITNGRCMAGFPFSCNFRDYSLERYVKKMQELGYTIIVYVQDGQGSNTTRSLHCIYSPGTFFSSDSDSVVCCLSNNTCCFWIERVNIGSLGSKIIMGMSNIDIYTGRTTCFECESEINARHNQTTYDELERFISSFQPNEVIIISNLSESYIQDIINFANIRTCANPIHLVDIQSAQSPQSHPFYVQAKNCQKQTYRKEMLGKFFSFHVCNSIFQSYSAYEFTIQSFTFLLHFMHEHNPHLTHKITEPEFENKSDRMVLANHTLEQLNIIDAVGSGSKSGKYSSVYRLLNHCKTPMGARRFYYRLLHPSFNVAAIQHEYDITEYILGLSDADITKNKKYLNWRAALENVKDVEKLHRKIYLGKIYPKSLHILYTSLEIINEMYEDIKCDQTLIKYVNADACPERITEFCKKIKKEIDSHFIIEKCKTIDSLDFDLKYEDCFIQPGVSKELDATFVAHEDGFSIFESIRAHCNDLITLGEKTTASGGKEKEFVKRHETEKLGLSLQTTDRRSKILLDQIAKRVKAKQCVSTLSYKSIDCGALKTFDFDLSLLQFVKAGNSTVTFIHEKIHSVCSSISQTRGKIRDEIGVVFGAFVGSLKEHQESFQTVISFVTDVDLMQNQAHIACTYKYCKPEIKQNSGEKEKETAASFVDARDIRHCLIEQINEDELYVCNDVSLGLGERGMLLYGTNAVGKTSLIRALGICIIMAQAGLYVPCSSFKYFPYTNIMTRILGNDNLFKGMSTFAVEMSELRVILKCADPNSLILGDELCSGTEIDSAISIFVAGLQKLHSLKSCFIFATHMHEIVDYEEIVQMQLNDGGGLVTKHMAVTYDRARDVLIYDRKLRDGAGPSMYGLEVCKSLHLPDDFLKMANDIRLKYRNKKQAGDLNFKPSHFNAHKIKGICELCKQNLGEEVHHLQHQKEADEANFIQNFHKNHPANLMTVCESCHLKMHGTGGQQLRRVLTTGADGYILRGTQGSPRTPPYMKKHHNETNFHEWANNM